MPDLTNTLPVSAYEVCVGLLIGLVLGISLRFHFIHFSKNPVKRSEISDILPFIALIIVLIISIVKSSIALSLGLVGALSIVRFRTPIKDPEELTYIFMAIAIGLGLGANQIFITVIATAIILISMAVFSITRGKEKLQNLYLSVEFKNKNTDYTKELSEYISTLVDMCDIRSIKNKNGLTNLTFYVSMKSTEDAFAILKKLEEKYKEASFSIADKKSNISD